MSGRYATESRHFRFARRPSISRKKCCRIQVCRNSTILSKELNRLQNSGRHRASTNSPATRAGQRMTRKEALTLPSAPGKSATRKRPSLYTLTKVPKRHSAISQHSPRYRQRATTTTPGAAASLTAEPQPPRLETLEDVHENDTVIGRRLDVQGLEAVRFGGAEWPGLEQARVDACQEAQGLNVGEDAVGGCHVPGEGRRARGRVDGQGALRRRRGRGRSRGEPGCHSG